MDKRLLEQYCKDFDHTLITPLKGFVERWKGVFTKEEYEEETAEDSESVLVQTYLKLNDLFKEMINV